MAERSALVTGASRGIGLGVAEMLAESGFALTISGRDPDRLSEVADRLGARGAPRVVTCAGDLADPEYPARLAAAHQDLGDLDVLVLNAGVGTAGTIADYPMRRLEKTVTVNFTAPFVLLQSCLPMLRAAAASRPGSGARVVALASISGVQAEAGLAAYGATKAALISLVETLNAEESVNGITATAIAPGYVETDMSAWVTDRIPAEEMIPVEDIVRLVSCVVQLSARSVVPRMVVTRAAASGNSA